MKKLVVSLLFVLSFQFVTLVSYAQEAQDVIDTSPYMWEEERDPCDFRSFELDTVETLSDMFYEHAEEKIVQRLFKDPAYQNLVRGMTDDLIASLENSLDVCRDGQIDLYIWTSPMSFAALEDNLREYVETLVTLKQFSKTKPANDVVAEHVEDLQEIVLGKMSEYLRTNPFLEKEAKFSLKIGFQGWDEVKIDFDIDTDSLVVGDVWGTVADSESNIFSSLYVDTLDDGKMDASISLDVFARMVDNHLYIKVDNLDVDISTEDMDKYAQGNIDAFLNTVKVIEGKWIDVFGVMTDEYGMMSGMFQQSFQQQKEVIMTFLWTDWLTTYREEGNVVYAGLNPLACDSFALFWWRNDCLKTWKEMYIGTDGQGILKMSIYKDTVGLSISQWIPHDEIPDEFHGMLGKDFISWSEDEIRNIHIPFGEYGQFLYNKGNISLDAKIPSMDYDWETGETTEVFTDISVHGTFLNKVLALQWDIVWPTFKAMFRVDKKGSFNDMQIEALLEASNEEEDIDFSVEMSIDAQQTVISDVNVVAPSEGEIVDLSVLP